MAQDDETGERMTMRIGMDLVPEWSNAVERMARYYGEEVAVGVADDGLTIDLTIQPHRKEGLLADMQNHWDAFVQARKQAGRWTPARPKSG